MRRGIGLSAASSSSQITYTLLSEMIPETLDRVGDLDPGRVELAVLRAVETAVGLDRAELFAGVLDEVIDVDRSTSGLLVHLATDRRAHTWKPWLSR